MKSFQQTIGRIISAKCFSVLDSLIDRTSGKNKRFKVKSPRQRENHGISTSGLLVLMDQPLFETHNKLLLERSQRSGLAVSRSSKAPDMIGLF